MSGGVRMGYPYHRAISAFLGHMLMSIKGIKRHEKPSSQMKSGHITSLALEFMASKFNIFLVVFFSFFYQSKVDMD